MAVEITSRILAVTAAVAFTWVLTGRQLPFVPNGRWTVVALFALGLGMCTLAGIRDGVGTSLTQPAWLTGTLAAFGIAAFAVLVGVIVGLPWRIGVLALGLTTAGSWLLALGYGIYAGLDTAPSGVATVIVAAGASLIAWRGSLAWRSPTAIASS